MPLRRWPISPRSPLRSSRSRSSTGTGPLLADDGSRSGPRRAVRRGAPRGCSKRPSGSRSARGLPELSQLEASTLDGSVFAVRRDGRLIAATTRSDPTVGLIFYDLKHCLGSIDVAPAEEPAAKRRRARGAPAEKGGQLCVGRSTLLVLLVGSVVASILYRRRSAKRIERVELYAGDGAMVSLPDGSIEAEELLGLARDVLSVPG